MSIKCLWDLMLEKSCQSHFRDHMRNYAIWQMMEFTACSKRTEKQQKQKKSSVFATLSECRHEQLPSQASSSWKIVSNEEGSKQRRRRKQSSMILQEALYRHEISLQWFTYLVQQWLPTTSVEGCTETESLTTWTHGICQTVSRDENNSSKWKYTTCESATL